MKKLLLSILPLLFMACSSVEPTPPTYYTGDQMVKSTKRGVCFSFKHPEDLPLLSPYISWSYNWGNSASNIAGAWFDANEMDFCPMCWSGNYSADKIRSYVAAHPNTKYLLAFNEPNLTDQAHMTPSEAAEIWQPVVDLAKELNLKLVSPAMNYGTLSGYTDPIKWLDEFFSLIGGTDDIYAISVHCYMASPSGLKGYIELFRKYNKPVWLTEFCAWESTVSSVETQMNYMCAALNYLEQEPLVERYAWFIPRADNIAENAYPYMQLLTKSTPYELTDLGRIYCYFSTFDANFCHDVAANPRVPAHQYIALSDNSVSLRPTADGTGLYFNNLTTGMWIEYQVKCTAAQTSLSLHYASYSNSQVCVYSGDVALGFLSCPKSGSLSEYTTATFALPDDFAASSYNKLRIEIISGSMALDYLEIK